jgi:hypothetical protein
MAGWVGWNQGGDLLGLGIGTEQKLGRVRVVYQMGGYDFYKKRLWAQKKKKKKKKKKKS